VVNLTLSAAHVHALAAINFTQAVTVTVCHALFAVGGIQGLNV